MRISIFLAMFMCVLFQPQYTKAGELLNVLETIFDAELDEDDIESGTVQTHYKISDALREALEIGTQNVVARLGRADGFLKDSKVHIPLPRSLRTVDSVLEKAGMSYLTDDLEVQLNRAAEQATPKAKKLFISAIKKMTIKDAKDILNGNDDAATVYLRRTMGRDIEKEMEPIVQMALDNTQAMKSFDAVVDQYSALTFISSVRTDLREYVIDKTVDGIFYYVAKEEKAIRKDPAKRTTDLLRVVFGTL